LQEQQIMQRFALRKRKGTTLSKGNVIWSIGQLPIICVLAGVDYVRASGIVTTRETKGHQGELDILVAAWEASAKGILGSTDL